jgi:hypothetical protein
MKMIAGWIVSKLGMTGLPTDMTSFYRSRIITGPIPAQITSAQITLRYGVDFVKEGRALALGETLAADLRYLEVLVDHGFLGVQEFAFEVQAQPATLTVSLWASELPFALVVMALRMLVRLHDASPDDFARLQAALDDDQARAVAVWHGVSFAHAVAQIEVIAQGAGLEQAFDPIWLSGQPGALWQSERLELPGCARFMPDDRIEDALLMVQAFGGFWPLGQRPDFSPDDTEWFTDGSDLVLTDVSIETASLRAILACLGCTNPPTPLGLPQ